LPGKIRKTPPIKKRPVRTAGTSWNTNQMQARQALLLSIQHVMCLMYFVFRWYEHDVIKLYLLLLVDTHSKYKIKFPSHYPNGLIIGVWGKVQSPGQNYQHAMLFSVTVCTKHTSRD
jgi:hypothetical protein